LKNQGPDAYRPDAYGKTIVVERIINKAGTSSYKLKNGATGKVVASTAGELRAIVEHFDIQVDNECAVLMQETSKKFLHGDSPAKKYQLFLKATQLEKMKHDLSASSDNIKKMKRELSVHNERVPELQERVNRLTEQAEQMKALESSKQRLKDLKIRLSWSVVAQLEREVQEVQNQLDAIETQRTEHGKLEESAKVDLKKAQDALNARMTDAGALEEQMRKLRADQERLKAQRDQNAKERARRAQRTEEAKRGVGVIEKRLAAAKRSLEEARSKLQQDTQRELDDRDHEINDIKAAIAALKDEAANLRAARDNAARNANEKEQAMRQAQMVMEGARREHDKVMRDKQQLEQSKQNRDVLFGNKVPAIQKVIAYAHHHAIASRKGILTFPFVSSNLGNRLRQPPIGPLGKYLSLIDDRFGVAVEGALGGSLGLFAVSCKEDEVLLNQELRRAGLRPDEIPPIVVTGFLQADLDYSSGSVPQPYKTILSLLKSTNPTVTKVLVDQQRIESKIVAENRDEAIRILRQDRPANLKEIYLMGDGSRLMMSKGALVEVAGKDRNSRLVSNQDGVIRDLNERARRLDAEYKQHQTQFNQARARYEDSRRDSFSGDMANRERVIGRQIAEKEVTLGGLTRRHPPSAPAEEDLNEYEDAVRSLEDQLKQKQQEYENVETEASQVSAGVDNLAEMMKQKEQETLALLDSVEKQQKSVASASALVGKIELALRKMAEAAGKSDAERNRLVLLRNGKEESITAGKAKAAEVGPRPDGPINETYAQLEAKLRTLQATVDEQVRNARGVTMEQVDADLKVARNALFKLQTILTTMDTNLNRLDEFIKQRTRKWLGYRKSIARRTNALFTSYLTQKGFEGSLDFDHDKGELNIHVNPDQSSAGGDRSTSTLSGGERSFSTVSLMLSLWDSMEVPFRAMDEFDVFMDAANRRVAIELLNKVGREKSHRQHIFLTPQEMPKMPGVNVLALAPPRD
jgi:structural maintenance of chromosomes protein 6